MNVQYYSDANEVESWLKEKEPLVSSHNYGKDDASAKVRHILYIASWRQCVFGRVAGHCISLALP